MHNVILNLRHGTSTMKISMSAYCLKSPKHDNIQISSLGFR